MATTGLHARTVCVPCSLCTAQCTAQCTLLLCTYMCASTFTSPGALASSKPFLAFSPVRHASGVRASAVPCCRGQRWPADHDAQRPTLATFPGMASSGWRPKSSRLTAIFQSANSRITCATEDASSASPADQWLHFPIGKKQINSKYSRSWTIGRLGCC
jgi:hypothetical protein